jgi:glycosyltransferase involved in cell wall biosynthesis
LYQSLEWRPLRLVLVSPVYPWRGGIAQHGVLLARALHEAGHDVSVIGYRSLYPRWLYPGADPRDASATALRLPSQVALEPLLRPLWPPSWLRAARAVRSREPDAVLLQWWVPYFAPVLACFASLLGGGPRRVFVCHNVLPHDGGGALDRLLAKLALGRGDGWLVHAASDETSLGALLGEGKIEGRVRRVTLPAFTLVDERPDVPTPSGGLPQGPRVPTSDIAAERAAARGRLELPIEGPLVLFFGFVRPYKGLIDLIDALPQARLALPGLRCLVAGEFWEPAGGYQSRAEELGVADALRIDEGYVPNEAVADYFAAADVVVLPYREATQSAVAPMALAAGRPVIASRVGGLPDLIRDGYTGLLVPPRDPRALAGAIARFFGEAGLAARMHEACAAGRDRLGWAPVVDALVDLAGGDRR